MATVCVWVETGGVGRCVKCTLMRTAGAVTVPRRSGHPLLSPACGENARMQAGGAMLIPPIRPLQAERA